MFFMLVFFLLRKQVTKQIQKKLRGFVKIKPKAVSENEWKTWNLLKHIFYDMYKDEVPTQTIGFQNQISVFIK